MSKHMQLTVAVRAYYQTSLASTYPRLARHLGYLAPELVKASPSLYELLGQLDHLLYRFEGTPLREVLLPRRTKLLMIRKSIEENLANWHLAAVDRFLYEIEDVFDEIELELD